MNKVAYAAVIAMLSAPALPAQDAAGRLTMTIDGEEQPFVLIQRAEGPNPGSRYSRLGEDVVMTIVGVRGNEPLEPADAEATVELRFTVDATGPEVRAGSVISYSTQDEEGNPVTRGGTVEVAIDSLDDGEDEISASGTFAARLPPDQTSKGGDVEGTFQTAMKRREGPKP